MNKRTNIICILALLVLALYAAPANGTMDSSSSIERRQTKEEMLMDKLDRGVPVPPPGFENKEYVKPDDASLKSDLNKLQYEVTQAEATEPPFNNMYWDQHGDGIFVDVVSGEPLFSSTDK